MKKYAVLISSIILVVSLTCLNNVMSEQQSQPKKAKKQNITKDEKKSVKRQSDIKGIGNFKIGETRIDIIKDLEDEFGIKTESINDEFGIFKMKGRNNSIFYLIPRENSYSTSICPDVKEYYIPVYVIADMTITELKLKFYRDVLYDLQCDSSKELGEALELKYGEPERKFDPKSISCFYKHTGNTATLEEKTFHSNWYNKDITASDVAMSFYSTKCEPLFAKYLHIYDSKIAETVRQCVRDIRKQVDDTKKQERLKNLKGF